MHRQERHAFCELGLAEAMGHRPILIAPDAPLSFGKTPCRCHFSGGKRLTPKSLRARLPTAIEETPADGG